MSNGLMSDCKYLNIHIIYVQKLNMHILIIYLANTFLAFVLY